MAVRGANAAGEATAAIEAPDGAPHELFLVYVQRSGGPANNMFELDELNFAIRIPRRVKRALLGGTARAKVTVRVSYRPEGAADWRRRKPTLTLLGNRSR